MATTSSIIIEVNDAGAVQAFKRVNAEAAKLGPTLQPIQRISEQTFNNIEAGALRARESAALLGEEFGIKIPRALRGTIAEASLIGPIFSTAFSGLALVGFVDIAIHAGEQVEKLVEKFWGHEEQAKKTREAQAELNKVIAEGVDRVEKLQDAYHLIGLQGLPRLAEEQKLATEKFDAAKQSVADLTSRLQILKDEYAKNRAQVGFSLGIESLPTGPTAAVEGLKGAKEKIAELTKQLGEAKVHLTELGQETENVGKDFKTTFSKEHADGIREIGVAAQESITKMRGMMSSAAGYGLSPEQQINAELRAKQEELAKILSLYGEEPGVRETVAAASLAVEKEASAKRIKLLKDETDATIKIWLQTDAKDLEDKHATAEKQRRMDDETLNIERASAVASAPPWARAQISIVASYQERMDKIREMMSTRDLDEAHAARQQAAEWNIAFGQMRDNLASQMQGLFDDMTSGNIGKRFKKMFEDMVFQMVATWVLGMQGMRSASAGAMGRGPGGILGAIFGLGGGGGIFGGGGAAPGGTPPFLGGLFGGGLSGGGGANSSNASLISAAGGLAALPLLSGGASGDFATGIPLLGLGLSAGQGSGLPGIALPSGAAAGGAAGVAGGAGGYLAQLLTSSSFKQLAVVGGASLLINGLTKGGVGGALSGAAGGALIGAAFGGIGAIGGAIIGALVGLIGGLFGQHKGDKARIEVMEPLMAQIKVIKDSYDVFQTDYNTGVSELEVLRASSIANLQKIGGRQVSGTTAGTNRMVDDAEKYLKTTEAERQRRAQISFGPAQFHSGGFVDPSLAGVPAGWNGVTMHSGGEVPAILQAGEFVMKQSTVRRVGRDSLDRMNAGGGAGGGDVHLHFDVKAIDAQSFSEFLGSGGMNEIISHWRRGEIEGRL